MMMTGIEVEGQVRTGTLDCLAGSLMLASSRYLLGQPSGRMLALEVTDTRDGSVCSNFHSGHTGTVNTPIAAINLSTLAAMINP